MSYSISSIRYLDAHTLRSWFNKGSPTGGGKFAVVDVRDTDHIGGNIKGSLHFPASSLSYQMDTLISQLENSNADDIVFHCALSQQRGPSAAMKFLRTVKEGTLDDKTVWILRGGFTEWQQHYGEDESVTQDYQKDIWQYGY